jgi:hypothetical protein
MLLPARVVAGIVDGSVTRVYRRWSAPRAKAGGTQLTPAGVVAIDAVTEIDSPDLLTEADAHSCGERDLASLLKWLGKRPDDRIFRVDVHYAGADPRWQLRERLPDESELTEIARAVGRLDAAKASGPWTRRILEWIRDNPGVVSTVLAGLLDRELQPMKTDIRKLKALGLTISLDVGYRLSPRGQAYLDWLDGQR